jgi:CreA protein
MGPIKIKGEIKDGERVFDERRSLLFKTLQVVRFFDKQRNVLVYVAYSDRVIEGSPKNSISSVPIMGWPEPINLGPVSPAAPANRHAFVGGIGHFTGAPGS